jgi:hypothetical protein
MTLDETACIVTREDLIAFLDTVRDDFEKNGQNWENQDIPTFIEAFQAWLGSSKNYYRNVGIDMATVSPWKEVADAFAAARIYE